MSVTIALAYLLLVVTHDSFIGEECITSHLYIAIDYDSFVNLNV